MGFFLKKGVEINWSYRKQKRMVDPFSTRNAMFNNLRTKANLQQGRVAWDISWKTKVIHAGSL